MKYDKGMYINSGFYGPGEDVKNRKEKLVKCRKPHECMGCGREIKEGEYAVNERAYFDGVPVSCHTCLTCIEKWLEEIGLAGKETEVRE